MIGLFIVCGASTLIGELPRRLVLDKPERNLLWNRKEKENSLYRRHKILVLPCENDKLIQSHSGSRIFLSLWESYNSFFF